MRVFIKSPKKNVDAVAEYNLETGECKVLKGSKVSEEVSVSEKFRGGLTVQRMRKGRIKDCVLQEDVRFKSASTAANFVNGVSTNGLRAWKNEDGESIKKIIQRG